MWEPNWRTEGLPELGDLIQCKLVNVFTGKRVTDQGIVAHIRPPFVYFIGEDPDHPISDEWDAIGWRKWIGPEVEKKYERKVRMKIDAD